jgi:hypothetical protein
MNPQACKPRTPRKAKFHLEYLDDRIVPSAMQVAAGGGAGAVAAVAVAPHQEKHLAVLEAKHEQAVIRLARLEARRLAHHHHASAVSSQPRPTLRPTPLPANPVNTAPMPATTPVSPSPLPPDVSQTLQTIYAEYEAYVSAGSKGPFTPSQSLFVVINGTDVGIQVHSNNPGDLSAFVAQLQSDGMQVIDSSVKYGIVEGMLPIAQLPAVAGLPQTMIITPMYKPILY